MKYILPAILLLVMLCCRQKEENAAKNKTNNIKDSTSTSSSDTSLFAADSTKAYGLQILSGKTVPDNKEKVFSCLDSLLSPDTSSRQFYFRVFKIIEAKAPSSYHKAISSYAKLYIKNFPAEFAIHLQAMNIYEREDLVDLLGYNFYNTGENYQNELEYYFNNILHKCTDCTTAQKELLQNFKADILNSIQQQLD